MSTTTSQTTTTTEAPIYQPAAAPGWESTSSRVTPPTARTTTTTVEETRDYSRSSYVPSQPAYQPTYQPAYNSTTTTYGPSGAAYTTTTSSSPYASGTGSRSDAFMGNIEKGINRLMSRGQPTGTESYRSDPLGGYTYHGPDGSYEKKHKFTRRITRRGPGCASTYGSA
eukprot:TRINITY_DN1561_c0_g1_i1.p1 TRINITY_DN1561_c0_g1~~TRINITY_DN1561_c0_g1_i1.p1  ORF type:complete len:169 (+),score=56.80 TRINITY_DN1561_c0_g1_i1:203-709(+)